MPKPSLVALCTAAGALLLAACAGPPAADGPYAPGPVEAPPVEDARDGLSADQRAALRALPIPVLVPGDAAGFTVERFAADADGTFGSYAVRYRRADGACFEVSGANSGLGGPEFPLVSTETTVRDLGRRVRVYQAADDPAATSAQIWGLETVVSDFIDLDGTGLLFLSDTQGGCRPLGLDEATEIVAGLEVLDAGGGGLEAPPPSDGTLGPFAPADDLLDDYNAASTPEAAAEAIARRYEGEAGRVAVRVLEQTSYEAVALVTASDLRDDSVRDERLRLTYAPYGPTWELVAAGRQTRCQPGRGHQDWSDARCR